MVRLALAFWLAWAASAQADCRLALLLALDVSSSVDAQEYELQRQGLAAALRDDDIRDAILIPGMPPMALSIYEWSGRRQSTLIVDWVVLNTRADIDGVVASLLQAPRSHTRFPTAMGFALGFGATHLSKGPVCDRRVIDVSGDGVTNDGFRPKLAYRHYPFENVTVNGLAVLGADARVLEYFQSEVRHGPGAFVETSQGYEGFRDAMRRKLFREIATMAVGALDLPALPPG